MIADFPSHILKPNHRMTRPQHIVYLDIETTAASGTDRSLLSFRLAWVCYVGHGERGLKQKGHWSEFKSSSDLWRYIESITREKTALYIFTHNAFFDLQASQFFPYFTNASWVRSFYHEKGLSFLLTIRKDRRVIKVVSSLNYFAEALEAVGKRLGIEKGHWDEVKNSEKELSDYCRNDVLILKTAMEQWFAFNDDHDLGNFAGTKASQAFAAYRHRFMHTQIYIHDNKDIKQFEQEYYIAGRTECFQFGKIKRGPFLSLDVNSMYPFVMQSTPVPTKLIGFGEMYSLPRLSEALTKFAVIAKVALDTDLPIYPIRQKHKLIHPIGKFYAVIGTPLLKEAIRRGHLVKVLKHSIYRQAVIFKEFVDYFYSLRAKYKEEGNAFYDVISKYFMNSLYGKFGQFNPIETTTDYAGPSDYSREIVRVEGSKEHGMTTRFMNKSTVQMGRELSPNSMLAISAHITEYARALLWSIIEPLYPGKILYCDTDSVFIRERDLKHLAFPMDDTELGKLKIDKRFKALEIRGAKHYVRDGVLTCKGVPKDARVIGEYTYEFDSFSGFKTHLREGESESFIVKKIVRHCPPHYEKGTVDSRGMVKPFVLSQF